MTAEAKFISDLVTEEFGGDPRVVAALPETQLRKVQSEVKPTAAVPGQFDRPVVLPSYRPVYPRVEGAGRTTDATNVLE